MLFLCSSFTDYKLSFFFSFMCVEFQSGLIRMIFTIHGASGHIHEVNGMISNSHGGNGYWHSWSYCHQKLLSSPTSRVLVLEQVTPWSKWLLPRGKWLFSSSGGSHSSPIFTPGNGVNSSFYVANGHFYGANGYWHSWGCCHHKWLESSPTGIGWMVTLME